MTASTTPSATPMNAAQIAAPVEFNPLLPEFRLDPYPTYRRLQTEDPVHRSMLPGVWVLSRHADVSMVLRDARFGRADAETFWRERLGDCPAHKVITKWMLFRDPPDHTRLRTLVNKAFTPRAIENLRPRVQEIVNELLDTVQNDGGMDLMTAFAYPLPVLVICEMLGVPAKDRDIFKAWSGDLARILDPILTPDIVERGHALIGSMAEYFRELIEQLRKNPQGSLLDAMIAAEEQGDRLSEEELLANCILLFGAGHETTVNLIGNGTLSLLRHPAQLAKLQANPDLIESAIEECLRYESPVQMTGREVKQDVEIDGVRVSAGERLFTLIGAANRDPSQFSDPDRFDITREDNKHLAFGHGIHFCLGASLARLEGQFAIGTLVRRLPGLKLKGDSLQWRDAFTLRGLQALPVQF
ncbi:MAG: cytochrome P450 [Candidatus Binatia bacterium]